MPQPYLEAGEPGKELYDYIAFAKDTVTSPWSDGQIGEIQLVADGSMLFLSFLGQGLPQPATITC